jgi:trehalose 6-phosphate synthase
LRLSMRFVVPLLVVLAALAYAMVPLVDRLTLRWSLRDLDSRATLIANTIQEPLQNQLAVGSAPELLRFFARLSQDERLFALGYCASPGAPLLATQSMPSLFSCADLGRYGLSEGTVVNGERGSLYVVVKPMATLAYPNARVVLVQDLSFVERRSKETQQYIFYVFAGLGGIVSLLTVAIAQLSWRGWMQGTRALLRGEGLWREPTALAQTPELRPIARDLRRLLQDLEAEHRARDEARINWTPDALRAILHGELLGDDVIVVSNREPYIHQRRGERVETQRPASGLVTALEPIMRACSGTWIAHGSGSADREVVDRHDRIGVPPERPAYLLRRVWLSAEEESGYYYGFANEGLWPLCHIAHVRPTFRSADWAHYVAVNRRFAEAVASEAKTSAPIVLVQDYHFALLPKMIREILPRATVITFWHIPWPNPESFAICPWAEDIIAGLLGSSILGFHTQFHCNNFLDTVDRLLEARVDREDFTVSLGGKLTAVRRYPISIAWPPEEELVGKSIAHCRAEVRRDNALPAEHLIGIGVDRLDYTKGILERFQTIERMLELKPQWVGRFSFIQIAAPTRARIDEYQNHEAQVRTLATRINERFARGGPPPILLKVEHCEPRAVYEYYRGAELCFVSSLHDGMNLVAKEFVAARDDERGVLILSQFTGAARELPEALIVNPYDIDQCAMALDLALNMPKAEQCDRMRLMRALVSEFNVFRWAGRMLLDAATYRRRARLLDRPLAMKRPPRRSEETPRAAERASRLGLFP